MMNHDGDCDDDDDDDYDGCGGGVGGDDDDDDNDNALVSGHPGGLTSGNPRAFASRDLQIPPTQG